MKTQLEQIYSVFSNTEIEQLFIESATNLGFAEYFINLDLDNNDELAVAKCYHRVMSVVNNIPMSLLPDNFIESLR